MAVTTVAQFAAELKSSVSTVLEQLQHAGVSKGSDQDPLTEADKERLLAYLRTSHGTVGGDRKKITLTKKSTSEIKQADASGKARTIQVEVRKKRTFVKRDDFVSGSTSSDPMVASETEEFESPSKEDSGDQTVEALRHQAEAAEAERQAAEARARQDAAERAAIEQAAAVAAAEAAARAAAEAAAREAAEREAAARAQAAAVVSDADLAAQAQAAKEVLARETHARTRAEAQARAAVEVAALNAAADSRRRGNGPAGARRGAVAAPAVPVVPVVEPAVSAVVTPVVLEAAPAAAPVAAEKPAQQAARVSSVPMPVPPRGVLVSPPPVAVCLANSEPKPLSPPAE